MKKENGQIKERKNRYSPLSKLSIVHLTKVTKKGKEAKNALIEQVLYTPTLLDTPSLGQL